MVHEVIYMNLYIEMIRNHNTMRNLSETCGMTYVSLRRKMRGESPFLLEECLAIKAALHSDLPIETLFERKEGHA